MKCLIVHIANTAHAIGAAKVCRLMSIESLKRISNAVASDRVTGAVTLIQRFGWYGIPAALNLNAAFTRE